MKDTLWLPVKVVGVKEDKNGTWLRILTDKGLKNEIINYNNGKGITGEIKIDDGRIISAEQRKKVYASIRDISEYTGDIPEYMKEYLKFLFCETYGNDMFSLSDCSVTTAREFISFLIEFAITHDIPLSDAGINRTDDIGKFLYLCLKHKKCCICGKPGEIHHEDAIGMGNDRTQIDDSNYRKICLCRIHHSEAHTVGKSSFFEKYYVYGIVFNELG